jgi:hypothetical protein
MQNFVCIGYSAFLNKLFSVPNMNTTVVLNSLFKKLLNILRNICFFIGLILAGLNYQQFFLDIIIYHVLNFFLKGADALSSIHFAQPELFLETGCFFD